MNVPAGRPRSPFWRLVTVDIDGTITREHGWKAIADRFGRTDEFDRLHRRFEKRTIGLASYLAGLMTIARGHRVREVEAILASTPRLRHLRRGVRALQRRGARVALLSHNPPFVLDWYVRRFGFDGYARESAAHVEVERGRIGPAIVSRPSKLAGAAALLARWKLPPRSAVHIGDGRADGPVFRRLGAGVALNPKDREVLEEADAGVFTDDFDDVVRLLRVLRPRGER